MTRLNLCSFVSFRFLAGFSRWRIPGLSLLFLAIFLLFGHAAHADTTSLTLAWEGSAEPGISYKLFCRVEGVPFNYDTPAWYGNATTCTIQIQGDQSCYFVVRACDDTGNESADSNEVQYTPTDTDGDGLPDVIEIGYGTDPEVADTDGDGMDDGDELEYWGSDYAANLLNPDVDGDGFLDGEEIANGSDPRQFDSTPSEVVYEDAEDGQIHRWGVNAGGAAKASIENMDDESLGSRAIDLSGKGMKSRFILQRKYGLPWHNTGLFVISWRMQYSEKFRIEIGVTTGSGKTRIMTYEPTSENKLGRGKKVRFGLGSDIIDGNWYCFARDLRADLSSAQPGEVIAEVNNFQIRGSGRLDDIKLMAIMPVDHDTDGDLLSDKEEVDVYHTDPHAMDSDGDGISDSIELNIIWGGDDDWDDDIDSDGIVNLLDFDSDGDGISDGQESEIGTSPADSADTPPSVQYEDGSEEGLLLRWRIYRGSQQSATIKSVETSGRGKVVELSGKRMGSGYELANRYGGPWRNGAHREVSFSMKFSEKYRIEFEVMTDAGLRLMWYEPKDVDKLGRGKKVRFGLGTDTREGLWFNFSRDLQEDLDQAQPGRKIIEINRMRVRGSGLIDDVILSNTN